MLKTVISVLTQVLLFTCFVTIELSGQRPGGQRPGGGQGRALTLSGSVIDQETNAPLEFATISVYSLEDSTLVGGGITDLTGLFEVSITTPRAYAVVEYISYASITQRLEINREQIRANQGKIKLEPFKLAPAGVELEGVTVRAEKSETQFSLDKRVFNVGKDLANQGGSAADILDNVPSVTVDIEGAVSLRGSDGVRILIDGKPSGLANQDNTNGLQSIPSNLIESVEVITNPSSRYEAEGMAGIINIVLKKDKGSGFNGSFDVNLGAPLSTGIGANLNYRKGKVNWFANYGLNYRTGPGSGTSFQEQLIDGMQKFQTIDRSMNRTGLNNSIRFGFDFLPNEKETLTGAFLYRNSDDNNDGLLVYEDFTGTFPDGLTTITERTDDEREDESNLEYSLNFTKQFSSRKHTWTTIMQYQDNLESEGSDLVETVTFGEEIPQLLQRSNNDEGEKQWLFQTDFKMPLWDGKGNMELGARASFRDIDNDYLIEEQVNGVFEKLDNLSNTFEYDENVLAVYSQLGNETGKFSYQLGLRAEYSDVTTNLLQTNEVNARNYFNLFPSSFLNYKITPANSLQANYSRRIRRPRFWDLNPFFTFSDNRNTFGGNPNLDPEFTDSYELNFISFWDNLTVSTGIFYRHTKDIIQRILEFNPDGTTNRMPQNLGTGDDTGAEFTVQYSGLKWLRIDANANLFRQQIDVNNAEGLSNTDNFTWNARVTPRLKISSLSDLQIRFNYRAPRQSVQGTNRGIASLDLGWNYDILSNQATVTLSVRDLLNSRRRQGTTIGDNFFRESEFQWRARSVNLAFNYRINQKKKRQRPSRDGGNFEGGEF